MRPSFVYRKKKQWKEKERKRGNLQVDFLHQENHYVKPYRGVFNWFCKGEGVKYVVL